MYLGEVCSDSFVLLRADWPVDTAYQLIERLDPTHVIVHRTVPEEYYYLYPQSEALDLLTKLSTRR
jgi:hypothetical protein